MSASTGSEHDWRSTPLVRLSQDTDRPQFKPLAFRDEAVDLPGLELQRDQLLSCLVRHLAGLPTNHVLLYGPRGCGKSSLVYLVLGRLLKAGLKVITADSDSLQAGWDLLADQPAEHRFLLVLDEWGFDDSESSAFRSIKSLLEGALDSLPENFLLCVTSNRRHLVAEPSSEGGEIHPLEASQERLALADRLGLWIRVPAPDQNAYLEQVFFWLEQLAGESGIELWGEGGRESCAERALAHATGRGQRSGRVARQFAREWVGRRALLGQSVEQLDLPDADLERIRTLATH